MRSSYVTDFDLSKDIFKSDEMIDAVSKRFGITEDEAARSLLGENEYEEWLRERAGSTQ